MKKAGSLFLLVSIISLLSSCTSAPEPAREESGMIMYDNNQSVSEYGILARPGRIFIFDWDSRQMTPLCARPECQHEYSELMREEEAECPAAYLGRRAQDYAIYAGKLWYSYFKENKWEFWTTDLTGENHRRQFEVDFSSEDLGETEEEVYVYSSSSPPSAFYQGYYYGIQEEMRLNMETQEVTDRERLIKICLEDGQVEVLTDWYRPEEILTLVGVYGNFAYYRYFERMADDLVISWLMRVDQSTREVCAVAKSDHSIGAAMEGSWLAYGDGVNEQTIQVYLENLETGEKHVICEDDTVAFIDVISNRKVLWTCWNPGTEKYRFGIYDIDKDERVESGVYSRGYLNWVNREDIWFCKDLKPLEGTELFLNDEDYEEFFYITEEDLIAGEEPVKVK